MKLTIPYCSCDARFGWVGGLRQRCPAAAWTSTVARARSPSIVKGMRREIFSEEHEAFRAMVREFLAREVTPYHEQWERDGVVSRDVWLAAGRAGLLGIDMDEKHGGGGEPDFRYYAIMDEEVGRAGATGLGFFVHNDMIGRYLDRLCTPGQPERWLPGYRSGELITAIAITQPGPATALPGILP